MKNSHHSRRVTALILSLIFAVLPLLTACRTEPSVTEGSQTQTQTQAGTETDGGGAATEEKKVRPKIDFVIPEDKNLAIQLEKIPIAREGMSEKELRENVLQFMELQLTFAYTPDFGDEENSAFVHSIPALNKHYGFDGCQITYAEGKAYGGMPYMQATCGSVYRWLPFYDAETGFMDWEPVVRTQRLNWYVSSDPNTIYPNAGSYIFGNTCASSVFWAYGRVSNSIKSCWSNGWSIANGFVKVGEYQLTESESVTDRSKDITEMNGKQKMYRSYAAVKGADSLVHTGHAILATADAHVEYHPNGTIDGEKSYLLIAEQKASFLTAAPNQGGVDLYSPLNSDGATYRIMGNWPGITINGKVNEMKWTFSYLYENGYIPFTIPELVGQAPVEKATVSFSYSKDSVELYKLKSMVITANYYISDLEFVVKDQSGKEVFRGVYCGKGSQIVDSITLSDALLYNPIYENKGYLNLNLTQYTDGTHTLEIGCRVSTGEMLPVYSGTLLE